MKKTKIYKTVLVSDENSRSFILHKGRDLHEPKHYGSAWLDMGDRYAEMYVLSEDRPEAGDWVYDTELKYIWRVRLDSPPMDRDKKIVASTDKNTTPEAWVPESLFPSYVSAYGKTKSVDVELEMEEILVGDTYGMSTDGIPETDEVIKINLDNSVSIRVVGEKEEPSIDVRKYAISEDFKFNTGFYTHAELDAYEKGREHEESVILKWIGDWDFSANSVIGSLLMDKFNSFKNGNNKNV